MSVSWVWVALTANKGSVNMGKRIEGRHPQRPGSHSSSWTDITLCHCFFLNRILTNFFSLPLVHCLSCLQNILFMRKPPCNADARFLLQGCFYANLTQRQATEVLLNSLQGWKSSAWDTKQASDNTERRWQLFSRLCQEKFEERCATARAHVFLYNMLPHTAISWQISLFHLVNASGLHRMGCVNTLTG